MKQYRITSADYVPSAEDSLIPDAVLHDPEAVGMHDLARMQELAGITETRDKKAHAGNANPGGLKSPMSIMSDASEKKRVEHEKNIKPGSPEWFKLWFAKPELTGEKPVGDESSPHTNSLMSVNVPQPNR
jgi:hypothetical protein